MSADITAAVHVGDVAPPRTFGPLTRTDIVRYAGASGDFNPIHHDEPFATAAGFPSVFSMGMLQAGLLSTFATDWLGADTIRRFGVRFREQVWPGDELTCAGTVTAVDVVDRRWQVVCSLTCTRQTGGVALDGAATFSLPR